MFHLIKKCGIQWYQSDLLPENLSHAFTTRKGGDAPPPLDGLSTGTAQYKEYLPEVIANRKLICSVLKMNYDNLIMTDQHHTDNIELIESTDQLDKKGYLPMTDAVIIKKTGIPVMLFYADCTPILLYDRGKNVLGAIHAGWKGTEKKIAFKTAQKIVDMFNTQPENIVAAIGPNIGQCCYEVSKEVAESLIETIPKKYVSDKIITYKNNSAYIDLKQINAFQLKDIGIKQIDIINECTSCNQDLFFSHRASGGKTGRQSLVAQT